ncbi:MAG: nucleotidyltransferase domain-containing protein [Pirellulaceae bacterium]
MGSQDRLSSRLPGYVIAAGTQVVLNCQQPVIGASDSRFKKPGSVGVVMVTPERTDGPYEVQFVDGSRVFASFDQLTLRRQEIDSLLVPAEKDWWQFVILKCVVGSKAYGLSSEQSDDDIRGIFLPSAEDHWSLCGVPPQLEHQSGEHDEVVWELEKFLRLALKANPNVLEVLWTPIVLQATPMGEQLRALRRRFLSKHIYKTYSGYVLSQFRRMKNQVAGSGKFKHKHAMHLIRLLRSGMHALQEQEILIDVGPFRDELLAIRNGQWSFEQIMRLALELESQFQRCFEQTSLPEQPDFAAVDQFLIHARRSRVNA